ncbi:MAG: hypothetical protein KF701_08895 [Anaerolineales bacterium]|nr:MAG: hypothetical protein KF701_08895 [Anaerolineales bacterium]
MTTSKVGYVLALFLLPLLAACSPAVSQQAATATEAVTATQVPPTATSTPEPTATPTEIPDPEVTFEQLALMDASIGSFVQDEGGKLIYNSPLYNTEVGKNIPVVQQYREVGLDGGGEVWIAPEKYPNAPIVIQDLDTGEIRQGPFRYDNDVRRRLTVSSSAEYIELEEPLRNFTGPIPLSGLVGEVRYPQIWDAYGISAVLVRDQAEKDGHLVMAAKSYIGDEEDMLAFYFDIALGPVDTAEVSWNSFYATYVGENRSSYTFDGIVANRGNFRGRYTMFNQIIIVGIYNVDSMQAIPSGHGFAPNAGYSYANNEETSAVLSILKFGGLPNELKEGIDYTDLSIYGVVTLVFR